jgi:hypothetical protein
LKNVGEKGANRAAIRGKPRAVGARYAFLRFHRSSRY